MGDDDRKTLPAPEWSTTAVGRAQKAAAKVEIAFAPEPPPKEDAMQPQQRPQITKDTSERLILIVEDEPVLRTSMARGLSKLSNIEIAVAGNVAEGKKLISALAPKVLVLDLHLPDGTGIELLSEVDRAKLAAATIFVTAYPQRVETRLTNRNDVTILEKPVPMAQLRGAVIAALDELCGRTEVSSPFCLADYMQLAGFSRRTVQIDLYRRGDRVGSVWVQDGFGYHAEDMKGKGPRALQRLLNTADVSIECRALAEDPTMPRTLDGSCEELLVESMRFLDEEAHRGTQPDPLEVTPAQRFEQAEPGAIAEAPKAAPEPQEEELVGSFDNLYARGVDALLSHQYADAYKAFLAASKLGKTTGLEANLSRLRAMGYGK
ncbi:MAG: response regulator [Polyangiaceae bacterium]